MAYLTDLQLKDLGLACYGTNVRISDKASIYSPENLSLGSHVRIDDFSIITAQGGVTIGNYVHIAAYSGVFGGAGVEFADFSGMSPRCTIFSESDDFSGQSMIHPFFAMEFKPFYLRGKVILEKYVQLGAGTIVLPNCEIKEGSVTGANSLVTKSLSGWGIYAGTPVVKLRSRKRDVIELSRRALET